MESFSNIYIRREIRILIGEIIEISKNIGTWVKVTVFCKSV